MNPKIRQFSPLVLGIASGAIYAYLMWLVFRNADLGLLSPGFLVAVPFVLGFLTAFIARDRTSIGRSVFVPALAAILVMVFALLFDLEFWFCLVLAAPVFLVSTLIGYLLALFLKNIFFGAVILLIAFPFILGATQTQTKPNQITRTVHSSIEVNAPEAIVWSQITNFEQIQPENQRLTLFRTMGLPRPISAQMSCETVGCSRQGIWEDGLIFNASIIEIKVGKMYRVLLDADTSLVNSEEAPLGAIGSPAFDMVDDTYVIEKLTDGTVFLHLYSTYTTATHMNPYVVFCLDFVMKDIQRYILSFEKTRAEALAGNQE